jgi:PBP1b-binding outer membrane lipoprotein LpoB
MKRITLILFVAFFLGGCSKTTVLTNEEIITETKKCQEAGMGTNQIVNHGYTGYLGTVRVECVAK